MNKTNTTAITPASGRGAVTRMPARRQPRRTDPIMRALDARRQLRPRTERFSHLKRMYD